MAVLLHKYPTAADWNRILRDFPAELSIGNLEALMNLNRNIYYYSFIYEWVNNLVGRIAALKKSYVMLTFYYEMGIPDDPPMDQNGNYYPNFIEDKHYPIKWEFDYNVDIFYYQLFSAWDNLGHILNNLYKLDIPKNEVHFKKLVEGNNESQRKLKNVNGELDQKLKKIINDECYKKANKLRNELAHNYSPGRPGMRAITDSTNRTAFCFPKPVESKGFVDNIKSVLGLLAQSVESVKTTYKRIEEVNIDGE